MTQYMCSLLAPHQLGFGVHFGAEAVAHIYAQFEARQCHFETRFQKFISHYLS